MSDLTLLRLARISPDMVPLHLIARVWRLGDEDLRAAMETRAVRAIPKFDCERNAVRWVLHRVGLVSIAELLSVDGFDTGVTR